MYTVYLLFHLSFHRKPLSRRDNNPCLWTLSLTLPEAGNRRFLPHTSSRAETFFSPILYRLPETIFRHSGSPPFPIISITKEVSELHFETSETNHFNIISGSAIRFPNLAEPSYKNNPQLSDFLFYTRKPPF